MTEPSRALVLAGGGVTGIAWEVGLLAGLARAGCDVTGADLVVGTSAGATVGAQVTSGVPLDDLLAGQLAPPESSPEISVPLDLERYAATIAELMTGAADAVEARARVGRMALAAETVPEGVRRAVIASRLPIHDWPSRALAIVAVDAESGAWVTFHGGSGVPLVDAVAASCAVPGVWPPVTIGARRYVDGGARSLTNADIPVGYDRVLVIVPVPMRDEQREQLDAELRSLGSRCSTHVVTADEASVAAIGPNPLDPSRRPAAAQAGLDRAGAVAPLLARFWG